jgi:hypothetical protein
MTQSALSWIRIMNVVLAAHTQATPIEVRASIHHAEITPTNQLVSSMEVNRPS